MALIPYDWCHYRRRTFRHRDTRTGRRPRDNTADGRERLLQAKNPKDLGETTRSWESRVWKRRSRPRWEPPADLHPGLTPPGQRDNRLLQFLVPTDARTEPVGNASGARLPRSAARSPRPPASEACRAWRLSHGRSCVMTWDFLSRETQVSSARVLCFRYLLVF